MILQDFETWLRIEGKRPNTVRRYIRIATDFLEWLSAAGGDLATVSPLDLQDWKQHLLTGKEKKYSIATINNSIKGLKTFFEFLRSTGKIGINPAEKLKAQKIQGDREPRWLDRAERSRLLFYVDNEQLRRKNPWRFARNRAICFAMLHAGLRVGEVVALEVRDVDLAAGVIAVRDGKGGKSRTVDMNRDLCDAVREWLDIRGDGASPRLFLSQRGGPLTENGITHLFQTLRKKTGIPDLTPHVLRHTFAHDLAERGVPLQTVADLLGHANLNYTRVYVTSSRKEKKAAVEKLAGERYS